MTPPLRRTIWPQVIAILFWFPQPRPLVFFFFFPLRLRFVLYVTVVWRPCGLFEEGRAGRCVEDGDVLFHLGDVAGSDLVPLAGEERGKRVERPGS